MGLGKSRYNNKVDFELLRLCSILNTSIIGGASKLFAHFLRDHKESIVVSYANGLYSSGEIYKLLKFDKVSYSVGTWFWHEEYGKVHRTTMMRHKLEEYSLSGKYGILIYDKDLSTEEIYASNGWRIIKDAGQYTYIYTPIK